MCFWELIVKAVTHQASHQPMTGHCRVSVSLVFCGMAIIGPPSMAFWMIEHHNSQISLLLVL